METLGQKEYFSPAYEKRYGVYSQTFSYSKKESCIHSFIVLKNGYGVIERFTRLHEYIGISHKASHSGNSGCESKLYMVVNMLNDVLIDHGTEYGIRHIFRITKPMLQAFFERYAAEEQENGTFRKRETILLCIETVTGFMRNLCHSFGRYMSIQEAELYEERYFRGRNGMSEKRMVPSFQVTVHALPKEIFRDIPEKVMEILLPMAFAYAEDIAFGLCLQAFAGLRGGEVCNVRQECSPLGTGIQITKIGNLP